MMRHTAAAFSVWVIESKDAPNEALRANLELLAGSHTRSGGFATMFISEPDVGKPLRVAHIPNLLIISCAWRSNFEQFIKACGTPSVWLDLAYQDSPGVATFRDACRAKAIEGSTLELSTSQLSWTLPLLGAYRSDCGSLLGCLSAGDGMLPTVYSTRLIRPTEVVARIDYLARLPTGAAGTLNWYPVLSSLATLTFGVVAELKGSSPPILQLCAAEMGDCHWMLLFQIPVNKHQLPRVPEALRKLREDPSLRGGLAYKLLTRECGLLSVTHGEGVVELATVFNPSEADGSRMNDPQQAFHDAFLFRRKNRVSDFNPQTLRYVSFPDRLKPAESLADAALDETGSGEGGKALYEKAQEQLAQVWRVGNDESFMAYLKGIDTSSGSTQARYVRLIDTSDKANAAEQREILKDLLKRYFALVEEARQRKTQRTG